MSAQAKWNGLRSPEWARNIRKWLYSNRDRMAVDKVPGFWKTEWINRKRGGISGRRDSPEIFYDIGTGRFDLEKQPRNGKKKGTWVFARVPFFFFSQRGISRRISVFSCVSCISWFIPSLLLPLDGSPLQSVHALLSPFFSLLPTFNFQHCQTGLYCVVCYKKPWLRENAPCR